MFYNLCFIYCTWLWIVYCIIAPTVVVNKSKVKMEIWIMKIVTICNTTAAKTSWLPCRIKMPGYYFGARYQHMFYFIFLSTKRTHINSIRKYNITDMICQVRRTWLQMFVDAMMMLTMLLALLLCTCISHNIVFEHRRI